MKIAKFTPILKAGKKKKKKKRHVLVLTIFRNQFSLYKSYSSYFRILIFILADRVECWGYLPISTFANVLEEKVENVLKIQKF